MGDRRSDVTDADSDVAATRNRIVSHVTSFVRDLRHAGADVPANAGIDAVRALTVVGFDDRRRVRVALRTTLVSRQADMTLFDRLFPPFWDSLVDGSGEPTAKSDRHGAEFERTAASGDESPVQSDGKRDPRSSPPEPSTGRTEVADGDRSRADRSSDPSAVQTSETGRDEPHGTADSSERSSRSTAGRRRSTGNDGMGDEQLTGSVYSRTGSPEPVTVTDIADDGGLAEAVQEIRRAIATLQRRRWNRTTAGNRIDIRRALRRSFATGGTVPDIPHRTRRTTGVRCLFLVDVSRSVLDTVDRGFLVRFLRSASDAWRTTRIFFFDTSVREVTGQFEAASAAAAARALRRAETEWGGGTRIGHAIESVRRTHPHAVDRTTTVFVISDGLEVGETGQLEAGMARLARLSNAVLWLNPLAASPAYEPTVDGMAVSLPYVDGLFAFTERDDVVEIARQLRLNGPGTGVGYRYDQRPRDD